MRTAIILAGGLGTRLRPVVSRVPKPMAPINGKPFLCYLIDYLKKNRIEKIILSVGYLSEVIVGYFGNSYKEIDIVYSKETQALGTGGGLIEASQYIKDEDSVYVLNGDTFFPINLMHLDLFYDKKKADVVLALRKEKYNKRYDVINKNNHGKINDFKKESLGFECLINAGIYKFNSIYLKGVRERFSGAEISLESDIFKLDYIKYNYYGIEFTEEFIDIGIPFDYNRAQKLIF